MVPWKQSFDILGWTDEFWVYVLIQLSNNSIRTEMSLKNKVYTPNETAILPNPTHWKGLKAAPGPAS